MNACAAGPFPSVAGVLSFSNRYPTQQGDANPSVAGVRGRIGKEMVGIRLSLDPKNPCLVGAGRYDTAACGVRSLGRKLPVSVGGTRRKWKAVGVATDGDPIGNVRSEEHTSELQSLMRISYAVFCLKKKKQDTQSQEN